jgi:hypothetical protein
MGLAEEVFAAPEVIGDDGPIGVVLPVGRSRCVPVAKTVSWFVLCLAFCLRLEEIAIFASAFTLWIRHFCSP